MICPFCREIILDGAIKCKHCGSMLTDDPMTAGIWSGVRQEEATAFIGANSSYYLRTFSKFTVTGREKFCATWNWPCFLFTFLWMLYRKMYMPALVTFVVFCVPGINLLLHVAAGLVGNYLYYRHVKESIEELRAVHPPESRIRALQEMGGTNRWVIALGILLGIVMMVLAAIFFSTIIATLGHMGTITI